MYTYKLYGKEYTRLPTDKICTECFMIKQYIKGERNMEKVIRDDRPHNANSRKTRQCIYYQKYCSKRDRAWASQIVTWFSTRYQRKKSTFQERQLSIVSLRDFTVLWQDLRKILSCSNNSGKKKKKDLDGSYMTVVWHPTKSLKDTPILQRRHLFVTPQQYLFKKLKTCSDSSFYNTSVFIFLKTCCNVNKSSDVDTIKLILS